MKMKRFVLATLAMCWIAALAPRASAQVGLQVDPGVPSQAPNLPSTPVMDAQASPYVGPDAPLAGPVRGMPGHYDVPGVSNWIRRDHPCSCNDTQGCDGEIGWEVYFRSGTSIPIGQGSVLSRNCQTGLTIEGGFHTLFFNRENTAAWLIDIGMVSSWNSGGAIDPRETFFLSILVPNNVTGVFQRQNNVAVTIRGVNRTFLNFGSGREWFFGGDGTSTTPHWRFGVDGGGRWGTESMTLVEIKHRTDVIGGAYVATHLDYEFPWYNLLIQAGVRVEYAYTWSDILQRSTDMSELNVLLSVGARF